MDDLIAYLRSLLLEDVTLSSLFAGAGASAVTVQVPGGQDVSTYPRIVIDAVAAQDTPTGEGLNQFQNGSLRVYCIGKRADTSGTGSTLASSPYTLTWQMAQRITQIMLGDPAAKTYGLIGSRVPALYAGGAWKITSLRGMSAAHASDPVPQVRKLLCVFRVSLSRSV